MAWAKLDDRLDSHPKIIRAWRREPAALGLWTLGLTYTSRHALDGFVPEAAVLLWAPPSEAVETLVDEGLWLPTDADAGYMIHDFSDYNPTGDAREIKREAGRAGGIASGEARRRKARAKRELEAQ